MRIYSDFDGDDDHGGAGVGAGAGAGAGAGGGTRTMVDDCSGHDDMLQQQHRRQRQQQQQHNKAAAAPLSQHPRGKIETFRPCGKRETFATAHGLEKSSGRIA